MWDQDAQGSPKTAPFEGPLQVFTVFYNVDPLLADEDVHMSRRWALNWRREESFTCPYIKGGDKKYCGFDPPAWALDRPTEVPRHEVRSKTFSVQNGENLAPLFQPGEDAEDGSPVLVFVRIRREEFPDINSFKEANEAPFKRTDFFFRDLWSLADKAEALRKTGAQGNSNARPSAKDLDKVPNSWFVDLSPDGTELLLKVVMEERDFPKDAKLKRLGENLWSEPKELGNSMWYKDGKTDLRLRGLWFDAFEELMASVGLQMDRRAAWCLWRKFTSSKEIPCVGGDVGGLVPIRVDLQGVDMEEHIKNEDQVGIIDALEYLIKERPFLSDATFLEFNSRANLHLQEDIAQKLYIRFCDSTPKYEGARNLVAWRDFERKLREHILKKTHLLEVDGERFHVGGIWFEPLYNVVITSMPEVPPWELVKELFDSYVDQRTGLCPLSDVYNVIAKLGRPGLKYEQFTGFVTRLGMKVDEDTLLRCFNRVDVEQNNVLDADEMKSGMNLLFQELVPDLILQRAGLMPDQVAVYLAGFAGVLAMMYLFLQLSFITLVGPSGGGQLNSIMQSVLAAGVAAITKNKGQGNYDERKTRVVVSGMLGDFVGAVAHRSIVTDKKDD